MVLLTVPHLAGMVQVCEHVELEPDAASTEGRGQAAALAHPPAQVKTAVSERIVLTDAFQIQGRGDLQAV